MVRKELDEARLRVFLSHAHSDKDVAEVLHKCIEDTFRGLLSVFRSSDTGKSIRIGDSIKAEIRRSLKNCVAAISLLSHTSINRPWINVEFGAVWMLDATIIPVLIPGLQHKDLPFQFSDMKVCQLSSQQDCTELIGVLLEKVNTKYPFKLDDREIIREGKLLHKKINDAMKARGYSYDDTPPPQKRTTLWVLGSHSDVSPSERRIIERILPIITKGLVDLEVRVVMGESEMLLEFAHQYRDALIASDSPIPNPIILPGKLRQRNLRYLFSDAIGTVPDLALLLGGGVKRGRVQEEYDMAIKAGIPVLSIPSTGGVAALVNSTTHKADDLYSTLHKTGREIDVGDLCNSILKAVSRYNPA